LVFPIFPERDRDLFIENFWSRRSNATYGLLGAGVTNYVGPKQSQIRGGCSIDGLIESRGWSSRGHCYLPLYWCLKRGSTSAIAGAASRFPGTPSR
jgi:hypothetical protein